VTFSRALLEVLAYKLYLKTKTLFFDPITPPLTIIKSLRTVPYLTKPPKGVIYLSVKSEAVVAFFLSSPFATL